MGYPYDLGYEEENTSEDEVKREKISREIFWLMDREKISRTIFWLVILAYAIVISSVIYLARTGRI